MGIFCLSLKSLTDNKSPHVKFVCKKLSPDLVLHLQANIVSVPLRLMYRPPFET